MKKTILALMIPALFATSASAVEIYSAEDGSKVDLYGRLQYNAGALKYQDPKATDAENFGGAGSARLGVNVKYALDDATALIGKYEVQAQAEDGETTKTRYSWLGFRFMETTDLTFGKSEAPRAMLGDLTDTFDIFGGVVAKSTGYNRIDDQVRLSYADNGVDLRAAYAFNDNRKQDGNAGEAARWGVAAGYTAPIGLGAVASYDVINYGGDNTVFDDQKDWGAGLHYTVDGFYFAGLYGQRDLSLKSPFSDVGSKYWELQAAYTVAEWTLLANYAKEDGRKAASGLDIVDEFTLGARYAFTPKTKVYAEYVINEISGQDDLYGVGVQYNF